MKQNNSAEQKRAEQYDAEQHDAEPYEMTETDLSTLCIQCSISNINRHSVPVNAHIYGDSVNHMGMDDAFICLEDTGDEGRVILHYEESDRRGNVFSQSFDILGSQVTVNYDKQGDNGIVTVIVWTSTGIPCHTIRLTNVWMISNNGRTILYIRNRN